MKSEIQIANITNYKNADTNRISHDKAFGIVTERKPKNVPKSTFATQNN